MKVLSQLTPLSFAESGCAGRALLFGTMGIVACLATGCNVLFGGANPPSSGEGTQFSGTDAACAVSLYDADFAFGFDLPADAELNRFDNEQDSLTNSLWTVSVEGVLINITARVREETSGATLADLVQSEDDDILFAGGDLLLEEAVTLANGGEAFHTIINFEGLTTSRVQALVGDRLHQAEAIIATDSRTDALDASISAIVLSLCVD
ncbi:MAG: hypothetical protein Q7R41_02900 [Phycisphaerales bacterium]|nr:hypothetical protein [Phycisphaerales bacterium]